MKIVDPLADPRWDERLRSWSGATIFHTSAWARVLKDSYGFSPFALCEYADGEFHALMPIMEVRSFLTGCRAVSLPFADYCEPFFPDTRRGGEVVEALSLIARERRWRSCEIRGGDRYFGSHRAAAVFALHMLDLSLPEQTLFHAFKESAIRNIRKARRQGVTVCCDTSLAGLKKFYHLHCLTRREHGLPPQPFTFFLQVQEHILSQGLGELFLATYQGQSVAGAVFFRFGRRVLFKFGASDRRLLPLRPNDLVMWEAIRWYAAEGFTELCLGRTDMAQYGLRRFKSKWGAVEKTLSYYRYEFGKKMFVSTPRFSGGRISGSVVSCLPLCVNRMVGRLLYRHVA